MTFWKAKVRISEENYRYSVPVMIIMRIMGLFPISVRRDKFGRYMQLSPLYLVYSISLGLFSIIHASIGLVDDLVPTHGLSIRTHTQTDAFVEMFDWGIVHVVAACGFFVVPSKFLTFFQHTKCMEEVDEVLKTKHTKRERNVQAIICLITLAAMTYQVTLDYFTYVVLMEEQIDSFTILTRYGCNYFGCVVMMMTEYEFQHMGSNLTKRLKQLNKLLETFDLVGDKPTLKRKGARNDFMEQGVPKIYFVAKRRKFVDVVMTKMLKNKDHSRRAVPKYDLLINTTLNKKLYGEEIDKIMKIYLKLCDALGLQNEMLVISGVCAITAAFFHLIEALYFMLSDLTETTPLYYAMNISWLIIHIARFIVVIEPYYGFSAEVETTKALVCKLQGSKVGWYISTKLRAFTLILGLRSTKFSLAGAAEIDRTMLTAIMGYATTYLVILLQYNETETEQQI